MENTLHADPVAREGIVARYLARTLTAQVAEEFENHYLVCDECYEELRAAELLIAALRRPSIEAVRSGDVTVIRFTGITQLTGSSPQLSDLVSLVDTRSDTKVLIDLERVSRIDSAGLGMLMRCFTHAVNNAGELKLLQPSTAVKRVLSLTKIDSIVPTFQDEVTALQSFENAR